MGCGMRPECLPLPGTYYRVQMVSKTQALQLVESKRGVSPVIGVILMVAVVVVLAAIIGAFAFGFGGDLNDTAPNAQYDVEIDGDDVTLLHEGGETIADGVEFQLDGESESTDERVGAGQELVTFTGVAEDSSGTIAWIGEGGNSVVVAEFDPDDIDGGA